MIKIKILILTLFFFVSALSAQERYLVYFKDKGTNQHSILNKSSSEYKQAEASLSKKSIERRKKTMGENYITYEDLPISSGYVESIKNFGVEIHRQLKWFNAVSCYLTEEQITSVIVLPFVDRIEKVKKFKRIEIDDSVNRKDKSSLILPKNNYNLNYGLSLPQFELSDIPIVHDKNITGAGVIIGILDSGFRWKTHPALSNSKVIAEYDFVFNDGNTANEAIDVSSQDNHGTYVMSLIAGYSEGNLIGDSFNSRFVLAKTENVPSERNVEEDNYAAALQWMDSIGVDIVTSSVGYSEFDSGQKSYTYADMNGLTAVTTIASNLAFERGIITVTSAGNERGGSWGYITSPADAFDIITVGAVDNKNQLSYFSSYGPTSDGRIKPEIMAQGQSNYGADAGSGGYKYSQGTSFSAPIAAGILGLLKSAYPHLNNKQVREIVLATGDKSDSPNNDYGYGLLSAEDAINYPNFQKTTMGFKLNKTFINENIASPNSVKIFYSVNGGGFNNASVNYDGTLKYSYEFNSLTDGDAIEYYFTFNNNGSEQRRPVAKNYLAKLNNLSVTTVDESGNNFLPNSFNLAQNYPNPFNPTTIINYSIPQKSIVSIKVFNMLGQEIKSLINSEIDAGNYSVVWNGTNSKGQKVSAGTYVYQMLAGDFVQSKKMIFLK